MLCGLRSYAETWTSWLNFSTGPKEDAIESILFRNNDKLIFNEDAMTYEGKGEHRIIPYSVSSCIFFSSESASRIENVKTEDVSISYSRETQQIFITGTDTVSQIRLVSIDGTALRITNNSTTISTIGLPAGLIITIAVCENITVVKKVIIK